MLKKPLLLTLSVCVIASCDSNVSGPSSSQISEFKMTPADGSAGDLFGNSVSISSDYAVVGAFFDDDNGRKSGSAYVFKRSSTGWAEEAKLLPSDGAEGAEFGVSVSVSGEYAAVGAHLDDVVGDSSGSAYMFKRSGTIWTEEAKLLPSDGTAGDGFGRSVSVSGDYAVVGTFGDEDNVFGRGSAYVFKRSGTIWAQDAQLLASDRAEGDEFGFSVSISGEFAAVGAFLDDDNGEASGSVYMYSGIIPQ